MEDEIFKDIQISPIKILDSFLDSEKEQRREGLASESN